MEDVASRVMTYGTDEGEVLGKVENYNGRQVLSSTCPSRAPRAGPGSPPPRRVTSTCAAPTRTRDLSTSVFGKKLDSPLFN